MPSLTKIEFESIVQKANLNINDFKTFIETGTFEGETIALFSNFFETCYTIELSEYYYNYSSEKYKNKKNINFYKGDSSKVLPEICLKIDTPCVFWLDGHYSHGNTAKGEKDIPLLEECKIISSNLKVPSIIIIDDVRLFGTTNYEDWSEITEDAILTSFKELQITNFFYCSSSLSSKDRMIIIFKP